VAAARLAVDVVRLGTSYVNWYLVADEGGVTIVDAGVPAYRPQLEPGLELLGRSLGDVRAILLTHSDGDHTGVSTAVREKTGAPIHLHPADAESARNRGRKKTDDSTMAELRYPGAYRLFWHFARNGSARPPVVDGTVAVAAGQTLDVPGRPRAIHTPGHTPGHVAYHFPVHGALFVGDAICTWHPTRGRRGPQLMAFNVSTAQAFESLAAIEGIDAGLVLVGHGEPWTEGPAEAASRARASAKADGRVRA
jgi:glyoxylase-like metal-dependent hydrolase (beta-lactamase superfamily II)